MKINGVVLLRRFATPAAILIALSCASTRVTTDWKDQAYQKKPQKVLVLAMMGDDAYRRLLEDELVNQLKAEGIDAIPGYTVWPENKLPGKKDLAAEIKEVGADTLFLTRLVDRKKVEEYTPGPIYTPPPAYYNWPSYYGGFYQPYGSYHPGHASPYAYAPGGYSTEIIYDIAEANLYDAATEKLIWSAVTESETSGSDRREIKSYVQQIMKALRKQKLLS